MPLTWELQSGILSSQGSYPWHPSQCPAPPGPSLKCRGGGQHIPRAYHTPAPLSRKGETQLTQDFYFSFLLQSMTVTQS